LRSISTASSGGAGPQRSEAATAAVVAANSWPISHRFEPFRNGWRPGDRALALVCDVLQRLTATAEPGETEAAIQSGRRLVALDPLSEYGQRTLMRAYARAGRREALRQP
jgi:hypothetical protein